MSFKSFARSTAPLTFTPPPLSKPKKLSAAPFNITTDLQPGDRIYYATTGSGAQVPGVFTRYGAYSPFGNGPEIWANWRGDFLVESWMPCNQVFLDESPF